MQYDLLVKAKKEIKAIKKQLKLYNNYVNFVIYDRAGNNIIFQAKLPVFENKFN